MSRLELCVAVPLSFIVFASLCLNAQTLPSEVNASNMTGALPYAAFGGVRETISYSTGNLNLRVPLLNIPGRKGMNVDLALEYDSKAFALSSSPYNWTYEARVPYLVMNGGGGGGGGLGWRIGLPALQATVGLAGIAYEPLLFCYRDFMVTLADGSKHYFGNRMNCFQYDNSQNATPQYGPAPGYNITIVDSDDASFLRLDTTNPSDVRLLMKDGSVVHFACPSSLNGSFLTQIAAKVEDSNGNFMNIASTGGQVNSVTDAINRVVTFNWTGSSLTGVSYKDSSGTTRTIALAYGTYGIAPTFTTPTNGVTGGGNLSLLHTITLPNNLTYTFQYNAFGELTNITYPEGGYTTYDYGGFQEWATFAAVPQRDVAADFREITAKHVCSSAVGSCPTLDTTTYTPTIDGTMTNNQYLDIRDPFGNRTRLQLAYQSSSCGCNFPFADREIARWLYQGENTLLKTIQTTYDQLNGYGLPQIYSLPIAVTTTLNDTGQTGKTTFAYDSFTATLMDQGAAGFASTATRSIDNVTTEIAYDFGQTTILRKTINAWLKTSVYGVATKHIMDRQTSEQIYNGSGTLLAQTTFEYDNYTNGLKASGAIQHDSTYSTSFTTRGNLTATQRWRNTDNTWLTTRNQYDDAGNVLTSTDPRGYSTQYSYADSWVNTSCAPSSGSAAAYLTSNTNALIQATTAKYNSCTGTMGSSSDVNGLVTTFGYDLLDRLSQVNHPDGGQETFVRQESSKPLMETLTQSINTNHNLTIVKVFDGVGRLLESQITSDPQGVVYADTTYDGLGRTQSASNPYRQGSDPTTSAGITTYTYDALDRKTSETHPDGSILQSSYCGSHTLVTDPTGRWRRSTADALERLLEVDEPNAVGATVASSGCPGTGEPIWITAYSYDALSNLVSVSQNGSHPRNFTYDSLLHLLTSANPESGTITYTYDANGNVGTKLDARSVTTTYGYDALNRQTGRTYSNGDSTLTFAYDGTNCLGLTACQNVGHRTGMTDGAGSESWAYQVDKPNLRTIHNEQRTNNSSPSNITKSTTYYLDLAGNVTQLVYPTGRSVNYTYDAADRPSTAADSANGITYATDWKTPGSGCLANAVCYTPQGSVYNMSIGQTSTYNGFNISETFNNRLQPNEIKAGTALDISYSFVDPVSLKNAGHVYKITNNLTSGRSQTFTYDQVNRIMSAGTTATTGSTCWGYQFTYDAWGNLLSQAGWTPTYNACTQTNMAGVTADGNNHLSGLGYDTSGNTLTDGNNTYTWNGESQLKTAAGVTYNYNGDGRRAAKVGSKLYWYGSGGEILSETNASGATLNDYIFFGGKRVATVPATGSALFYGEDTLGTSRVIVQSTGTVCYDADFVPFGGEKTQLSTCPQNYKFEGKERDAETQNDDFGARYYSWRFGRWLSSDWSAVPVAVPYANLTNPQTLNLYSMVADDPESFADLDGHDIHFANPKTAEMFERIASESPTFNAELTAVKADHNIDVSVQDVGAQRLPDNAPGDATVSTDGSTTKATLRVKVDDEGTSEHEMGHVHDVRTDRKRFFDDAQKDARDKGGPNEQCHDCRRVERKANEFRDKVEQEKEEYKKIQKQQRKELKRKEREKKKNEPSSNEPGPIAEETALTTL